MDQIPQPSPAELYETYLVAGVHGRWAPLLLDYAEPRPGERMLDLACGTGAVARRAAPLLGSDGAITALDINADMLLVAQRLGQPNGARIEWLKGEASALPEGPFDLVTCQQGLQFFPDRPAALRETRRVLAPHGRLALNVFRALEEQSLYAPLFRAIAEHLDVPVNSLAVPYSLGDPADLRDLLNQVGYHTVQITAETCMVRFPSPERFVALTVGAAVSVLPQLALNGEARSALLAAVTSKVQGAIDRHVTNGAVAFPMTSSIIVAR